MENTVRALLLLFVVYLYLTQDTYYEEGPCTCGFFISNNSVGNPLIAYSMGFNVSCDYEGETQCKLRCIALVKVSDEIVPEFLHKSVMKHLQTVKTEVFSKACRGVYQYTGMSRPTEICYNTQGKAIECPPLWI